MTLGQRGCWHRDEIYLDLLCLGGDLGLLRDRLRLKLPLPLMLLPYIRLTTVLGLRFPLLRLRPVTVLRNPPPLRRTLPPTPVYVSGRPEASGPTHTHDPG